MNFQTHPLTESKITWGSKWITSVPCLGSDTATAPDAAGPNSKHAPCEVHRRWLCFPGVSKVGESQSN